MKKVIIALLCFVSVKMSAQPYTVENGNTRHRFAQMELGVTQYFSPNAGKTQVLSETGKIGDYQFGANSVSAIFIGATHFWGHCDLALTIPIKQFGVGMKYGVDLQMKYYPWRIKQNKLRPYVGVSMNPFGFVSFILKDIKTYRGQISTKNYWLTHHLQRMMGAYIASLTAFAVVNAPERASILPWLVPAFLFIPLIIKWTRQYRIPMVNSEK
jgi:hypothetical protein